MLTLCEVMLESPCGIIAMNRVTDVPKLEIWNAARQYYERDDGMSTLGIAETLRDLGWGFVAMPVLGNNSHLTLDEYRKVLKTFTARYYLNMVILIEGTDGLGDHYVSYKDGRLHNTLGMYEAKVISATHFVRIGELPKFIRAR